MSIVAYPEFLQTRTYSAQQTRHMLAKLGLMQEGVLAAGDLKVAQRGAGANMSVDVPAGDAWVQGDDVARQGVYHLTNDATINTAISAAHASLPRLDQIVLRVYDSTVVGVSDVSVIEVVAGTATAGATLDNRTGAAALPGNCLLLADVLVPAAAASIVTANIRDRRKWARGASWRSSQTAGADYTVTSTSYVEIDSTNLSRRIECGGNPVRISLHGNISHSAALAAVLLTPRVDGVDALGSGDEIVYASTAGAYGTQGVTRVLTPSAGSHVFSWYWRVSTGTGTLERGADYSVQMMLEELRPSADNA